MEVYSDHLSDHKLNPSLAKLPWKEVAAAKKQPKKYWKKENELSWVFLVSREGSV